MKATKSEKTSPSDSVRRTVRHLRLAGKTFKNTKGDWIKIEWVCGDLVSYNCSGSMQRVGGRLKCSRHKMKILLRDAGYLTNSPDQPLE